VSQGGKRILLVGGSKGGVGKSLVSMCLLDLMAEMGPVLIESDTSNPDTLKSYGQDVAAFALNLDQAEGWMDLVNVCEQEKQRDVVINTAARNNQGVGAHGELLQSSLGEMERRLVTLWVINDQRDSLELLRDYLETIRDSVVHVVRNLHFGEESRFGMYNESKLRKQVEERGGRSLSLPALASRVAGALYSGRLTIAKAAKTLPLGDRAELRRWRSSVTQALGPVVHEAA